MLRSFMSANGGTSVSPKALTVVLRPNSAQKCFMTVYVRQAVTAAKQDVKINVCPLAASYVSNSSRDGLTGSWKYEWHHCFFVKMLK